MEWDAIKWFILGGALLLLVFFWIVWKFFFKLVKHFIIIVILGGAFVGISWYRNLPPPKNPAIGKHAYLTENGKYLGIVEGEGDDARRGAVWVTRASGDHQKMYGKARVTLKDKRDIASEPTPEPTATPTPASKAKAPPSKK
ncbi:MAG: hypothetical protein ACKVZH_13340 [Blastocatellia bacterium]